MHSHPCSAREGAAIDCTPTAGFRLRARSQVSYVPKQRIPACTPVTHKRCNANPAGTAAGAQHIGSTCGAEGHRGAQTPICKAFPVKFRLKLNCGPNPNSNRIIFLIARQCSRESKHVRARTGRCCDRSSSC